jgi:hypothetical protein
MKFIHSVLLLLATLLVSLPSHATTCKGKFANPITDICLVLHVPLANRRYHAGIAGSGRHPQSRRKPGVLLAAIPPSSA